MLEVAWSPRRPPLGRGLRLTGGVGWPASGPARVRLVGVASTAGAGPLAVGEEEVLAQQQEHGPTCRGRQQHLAGGTGAWAGKHHYIWSARAGSTRHAEVPWGMLEAACPEVAFLG